MKWILAGLAAALVPAAALASIPPSYKVLVVAPDAETEATSRALVEAMSTFNAFFWASPDIHRNEIAACLSAPDLAACARARIAARPVDPRARPVVIVARPVKPGIATWTCFGSGRNAKAPGSGTVAIDLKAALFGDAKTRTAERRKAMACIYAAETESAEG
ncbi:MAG TPA: hypothetical protein VEA44_16750 [Caulobacter sp.]|nr:hypothetical protein [Caulobacter sp.]